jgi:ribonuclease HI
MGIGGFILNPDRQYVFKNTEYVSARSMENKTSNNVAEYMAVLAILKFLDHHKLHDQEIIIAGDSELVIYQMGLQWKANKGEYKPYYVKARMLAQSFKNITGKWIPKGKNTIAVALSQAPFYTDKK